MAKTKTKAAESITRGSTNVFADLGFPDAEERQTKLRLAYTLNEALKQRKLTQSQAAEVLSLGQPKVSALLNYKLDGFSVERLMTLLTALDRDVRIVVTPKRTRGPARITVAAE